MAIRWDKLTVKAQEAMQRASELASEHGNSEVMPLHVLAALLEDREGIVGGQQGAGEADDLSGIREALRGATRTLLPDAHLSAHDDGVHRRHREHAQRVRVLAAVLRALVSTRAHDARDRRRCHARSSALRCPQALGRLAHRPPDRRRSAEGARASGTVLRPRAVDERHAASRHRRILWPGV